jgi:prophage regulatory protein
MVIEIKRQRILRMQDLPDRIGFRPSTIYDLIARGKFPRPFKIMPGGRAAGWLESTIDDWIVSRNHESQHKSK